MNLVRMFALVLAGSLMSGPVSAQSAADYPSRPVRLVVPFAAGGPTDVVTRILADLLSQRWGGKPVLIENRPGAGTVIATAAVANSAPDGHTVLIGTNSLLINPAIDQKLPYDTYKALTGASMIATQPVALVANLAFKPNTVPELVAYAKAQKEAMNYTSPGPRGVGHFAGEMLKQRAGIQMTHINYNGSAPALTDVMAGRVPIMFDVWHSAKRFVDAGKLKLIAGAGAPRLADAPNVPTIDETYPGFDVIAFNAAVVPAATPKPVVEKLSADIKAVVESPEFIGKIGHLGIFPKGNSPAELDAWMRKETARWAEIARAAEIKVD
jgi:tripartite-type tricarboxylate transporter receptor subunit TctC